MPLVMCPACKHEVSDKAFECPHCGHPLKIPQSKSGCRGCFQGCFWVILLLVLLFVFFAPIFPKSSSGVKYEVPREYIPESCNKLSRIFKGTKLTDLQKDQKIEEIKGKWVRWQARIKEVNNAYVGDNICVHIGCNKGNFFNDGYVYFDASARNTLVKYKVGQTIKFEGQLDGKRFLLGFRIKNAELIE